MGKSRFLTPDPTFPACTPSTTHPPTGAPFPSTAVMWVTCAWLPGLGYLLPSSIFHPPALQAAWSEASLYPPTPIPQITVRGVIKVVSLPSRAYAGVSDSGDLCKRDMCSPGGTASSCEGLVSIPGGGELWPRLTHLVLFTCSYVTLRSCAGYCSSLVDRTMGGQVGADTLVGNWNPMGNQLLAGPP
jgi:hypothetical protein